MGACLYKNELGKIKAEVKVDDLTVDNGEHGYKSNCTIDNDTKYRGFRSNTSGKNTNENRKTIKVRSIKSSMNFFLGGDERKYSQKVLNVNGKKNQNSKNFNNKTVNNFKLVPYDNKKLVTCEKFVKLNNKKYTKNNFKILNHDIDVGIGLVDKAKVTNLDSTGLKRMGTRATEDTSNHCGESSSNMFKSNTDNLQVIKESGVLEEEEVNNKMYQEGIIEENDNDYDYNEYYYEEEEDSENETSMQYMDREITAEEEECIKNSLKKHFLFQEMTDEIMRMVLEDLIEFQLEQGRYLYEEGDNGNYFYILKNGVLEVTVNDVRKGIYQDWDCFGELALLQKCKRTETVQCLTTASVFILDGESFRDLLTKMNSAKIKDRLVFLDLIPTFNGLSGLERHNIAEYMDLVEFEFGDAVINEGDSGDKLYIIKEGCVSCRYRGREIRKLYEREYFGENSIILETKRSLDVIALKRTLCYELSKASFEEAFGPAYKDVILLSSFKNYVNKNKFYKDMFIESQVEKIYKCFALRVYKNSEVVYDKNKNTNKKIVVLIEGNLIKEKTSEILAKKGEIYGEQIFMHQGNDLPYCILAYTDCIILEASWEKVIKNLNVGSDKKPLNIFNRINNLKRIFIFKSLSEPKLVTLAKMMKKQKFNAGELIVEENTQGEEFFLITKGRVRVTQNGRLLREMEEGNCFGEIAVINKDIRTASVNAITNVVCYKLTKGDFDSILDNQNIKEYLIKKISLQDTSIMLKDLYYLKFLGKGKFGSVSLVHNKKNIYAIKAVSRKAADKQKILSKYFVSERNIMLQLDHPFIMKMVKSLKNENYCFFLLEFVNGKNMDDYLNERKTRRNIYETKFYVASMMVMLEYLHRKSIAHRDIKPSNIMIDVNGYLKLIDFGTAKKITDFTYTIIGTPHYIPPEVLLGKGYSISCDYWSVGICMFEIFYGCYPFGGHASDILEVYKEVLHRDLVFPHDNNKNMEVKEMMKMLLHKKANQRCCAVQKLKSSNFFLEFNWDDLIDFKLKPPYVPETWDWSKNLGSVMTPFESAIQNELRENNNKKRLTEVEDDGTPGGYNKRWADEF